MIKVRKLLLFKLKKRSKSRLKEALFLAIVFQIPLLTFGQHYLTNNSETNLLFEKLNYSNPNFHSSIRPFQLNDGLLMPYFETSDKPRNIFNRNLIEFGDEEFKGSVNPIITLVPSFDVDSSYVFNDYQLGISVRANYGKKWTFFINTLYGIQSFLPHLNQLIDSTKIIPGFGKYMKKNGENYYYLSYNGYLSFSPWEELNLQVGIGKNYLGDGYRSLFLSDNATNYPFLKAKVSIWRFNYIWMFGMLKDPDTNYTDNKLRNKLLFTHYLSWNVTKWLNINFFESIVSNPVDSVGVTYFNVNYLNPVIFFRPTEFSGGSADNALLGLGGKIKLWKKYHFYGQLLIDEFVLAEIKSGNNWWGNKYGVQTGIKLFDFLNVKNLFARLEYNLIRPYTYSYSNSINNYGNHYQPLAHPSGANVEEFILQLHYHKKRYLFELKGIFSTSGFDTDTVSYGKDIYKSYEKRQGDYGNIQGQGAKGSFSYLSARASYLLNPKMKLRLDFSVSYYKHEALNQSTKKPFISLGIRTLIYNYQRDFL